MLFLSVFSRILIIWCRKLCLLWNCHLFLSCLMPVYMWKVRWNHLLNVKRVKFAMFNSFKNVDIWCSWNTRLNVIICLRRKSLIMSDLEFLYTIAVLNKVLHTIRYFTAQPFALTDWKHFIWNYLFGTSMWCFTSTFD